MAFAHHRGRLSRVSLAGSLLLAGEGSAWACSCLLDPSVHTARQIATDAAIVAQFEVVQEEQYQLSSRTGVGKLVRPVRTYLGEPQPFYRLRFAQGFSTCDSAFREGSIAILYRPEVHRHSGTGEPSLADLAGEALSAPDAERRLPALRAAVTARRPDAADAEYEDGGICMQLVLDGPGFLDLVRREGARLGRRVHP